MLTICTLIGLFIGCGDNCYEVGYEGYDNGRMFIGVYTDNTEYGYVISSQGIYLDAILEKQ